MAVTFTDAEIAQIKAKLIAGVKSVRTGDESLENYDAAQLLDLLKQAEAANVSSSRRTLAVFSSGLGSSNGRS